MRCWVFFVCFCLAACGSEPTEKQATSQPEVISHTNIQGSTPDDTIISFAKDTASHASYAAVPIKRPSGIYQFLLPHDGATNILHTVSFYAGTFRLQEEYVGKNDSIVVTEGTWAPSQGFIWLYKEQLVRGRYIWKGDTLQYFSPQLNKKFSLTKLTPASVNTVWQQKEKQGAVLYGVGTEPFWSIEVNRHDSAVLSMPDWTTPLQVKLSSTQLSKDSTVYAATGDSLQIVVFPYFCSDGMSDFTYTNKVTIRYKGKTYNGCGVSF